MHLPKPNPANVQYAAVQSQTAASVLAAAPGPGLAVRILRAWCASAASTATAFVSALSAGQIAVASAPNGQNSADYGDYGCVEPANTAVVVSYIGTTPDIAAGILYDIVAVSDE